MEPGEPVTYTLYARPLNVQRGNDVRVYLREFTPHEDPALSRGRSFYIDTSLDATVASYELPTREAEMTVDRWNAEQRNVHFSIRHFNKSKSVIHAHIRDRSKAAREALNQFSYEDGLGPTFFITDKYSGSKDVRSIYPSFTVPLQHDVWSGGPHGYVTWSSTKPSLDEMLRVMKDDTHMILDIETEGWDRPGAQERISMVVARTSKEWQRKALFSLYDLGTARIGEYEVVRYTDDVDLGAKMAAYISECDPLTLGVYNGYFDLIPNLRERSMDPRMPKSRREPSFRPGIDATPPSVVSASGRTRSVQVHGRFIIDMYNKLSTELSFLPNVKLGTVMHYFSPGFEEGSAFEKGQTYFQLAEAFSLAREGDPTKLAAAAAYTVNDGNGTLRLLLDQVEEVLVDAITLQRRTESVCKGFAGSSDERWSMEFFKRQGTFLDRYRKRYTPRLKPDEVQQVYFTDTEICQRDGQHQRAAFFYPTLFLRACRDIFEAWPDLNDHWEYYEHQGTIRRYRGLRKQQEMMVMPITEYYDVMGRFGFNAACILPEEVPPLQFKNGNALPFHVLDNAFKEAYGNDAVSLRDLNRRFVDHVSKVQMLCKPEDIINMNSHFFLLKPEAALALQGEKLGITLAFGPAVSSGKKAFLAAHDTIYQMGSKLTRGSHSMWENAAIIQVLQESLHRLRETGGVDRGFVDEAVERAAGHIQMIERSKLVRKRKRRMSDEERAMPGFDKRELTSYYGFLGGREVGIDEFMASSSTPDVALYEQAFRKEYAPELEALCQEAGTTGGQNTLF